MKLLLLAAITFSSFSAFSADLCTKYVNDMETKICLDQELKLEDAKLNRYYKQCRNKLDTIAKGKLLKAQKAWITFRDAECDYHADEMRGGSAESMIGLGCLVEMTKDRVEILKDCVELR